MLLHNAIRCISRANKIIKKNMVQENSLELFRMPSRQLLIFAVAESTFCSRRLTAYQIE